MPNSSQDPYGKSRARQEDRDQALFFPEIARDCPRLPEITRDHRDQAALFSARYAAALEALRARRFGDKEKGVPLEWFTWERLIVDECHESLVMGEEDADARASHLGAANAESRGQKEKRKCAQRELLGIGLSDPALRPLRVRRST